MEERKKVGLNCLVQFLFAVYLILLVWIILFKLQLSIHELDRIRGINLIPFYYDNEIGMGFHLKEVLENVAIFIPYGIYLCMLKKRAGVMGKVFLIHNDQFYLRSSSIYSGSRRDGHNRHHNKYLWRDGGDWHILVCR